MSRACEREIRLESHGALACGLPDNKGVGAEGATVLANALELNTTVTCFDLSCACVVRACMLPCSVYSAFEIVLRAGCQTTASAIPARLLSPRP